jgi:hypothetical protein
MTTDDAIPLVERLVPVKKAISLDDDEPQTVPILVADIPVSILKGKNPEDTFQRSIEQMNGQLRAVMIDTYRNLVASNLTSYEHNGGKPAAKQAAERGYADQGTLPDFISCGKTFNASGALVHNALKHSSTDQIGYRIMGTILVEMVKVGALPVPQVPSLPFLTRLKTRKRGKLENFDSSTKNDWDHELHHASEENKQEDLYSYPDANEADDKDEYIPGNVDSRQSAYQFIKKRRGQTGFRNALLDQYDRTCVISGCQITEILEAAHIKPYRGENDNHPENGLLLRSDLHTLFDLDLMGIEPENLIIRFHPSVKKDKIYRDLADKRVRNLYKKPSLAALKERWELFQKRLSE